jgi:8-oxo-dGTP diphosphatase
MAVRTATTKSPSSTRAGDGATPPRARPLVDVRIVLFTVSEGQLRVACPVVAGDRELPRGEPTPSEPLDASASRIVREATGIQEHYIEQLYTLSIHESRDWSVIVSYMALVRPEPTSPALAESQWLAAGDLAALSAADQMVVEYAVVRLRAKLGYTNIAFYLLPETFTLSDLQETYEIVLARRLDKRNFRRRVIASGILAETEEKRREGSHSPATLYRFRPTVDRETYLTPPWAGSA